MSNTVWLYISIATSLVAYAFYAYTLFSKEGFDGKTIRLFLVESMLLVLAFVFCASSLYDIALCLIIAFFAVTVWYLAYRQPLLHGTHGIVTSINLVPHHVV